MVLLHVLLFVSGPLFQPVPPIFPHFPPFFLFSHFSPVHYRVHYVPPWPGDSPPCECLGYPFSAHSGGAYGLWDRIPYNACKRFGETNGDSPCHIEDLAANKIVAAPDRRPTPDVSILSDSRMVECIAHLMEMVLWTGQRTLMLWGVGLGTKHNTTKHDVAQEINKQCNLVLARSHDK